MSVLLPLCVLAALAGRPQGQEASLERRRTAVVEVVERVKPAVVSISTNVSRSVPFFQGFFVENSPGPSGTGAVIFEDGFIITNYHVINGATRVQVRFDETDDDKVYDASIVSTRPEEDLALLKIEGDAPFHTVTLCESDPILGEPVIAIGNAFGHTHTVSTGIVSGLHRNISTSEGLHFDNLIQTDASINPGNSGGPLLNINGELIGINNAMQNMAENIGFAIPVNHVRKVLSEQLLAPSTARAWLGFDVDENTLAVTGVVPEGPADVAGLRPGDHLVSLDGHALAPKDGPDAYRRVRISIEPGTRVELTALRGRSEERLALEGWNRFDGLLFERLGMLVETVKMVPRGGDAFLRVTRVQKDGPAGRSGVQVGDILTTVRRADRREVWFQRADDLANFVARLPSGTELTIEVWRDLDEDGRYFERNAESDYSERFRGPLTVR